MNIESLHQEDDELITGFLAAERAFLAGGDTMSQEGLFTRKATLEKMREKLADDLVALQTRSRLEMEEVREAVIKDQAREAKIAEAVKVAKVERLEEAKQAAEAVVKKRAEKAAERAAKWKAIKDSITGAGTKAKSSVVHIADKAGAAISSAEKSGAEKIAAVANPAVRGVKWHGPMIALAGVTYLAAFGAIVGGVAVGMVKLLNARAENKANKEEIIAEIRKEILKASKPGMKVTMEGGDKDKLGRLMVNGRPANQIRGELEKILKSDKSMTPEQYIDAVKVVENGGHKFLADLDNLNRVAQTYQNSQNIATVGVVGMYVVFGALAFVCWLGYRVYQFLIRKLS